MSRRFGRIRGRRESGGIGRRASLRSWWPEGRGGSSPPFRIHEIPGPVVWTIASSDVDR